MRIALGIEYNGTNYHGWQSQQSVRLLTVQECLEQALSKVADRPIALTCAGRTDVGVHALGQVAHFDFDVAKKRSNAAWLLGGNHFLPPDIRIKWVKKVPADFHARYAALARHYRYFIYNSNVDSAILAKRVTFYPRALNVKLMQQACCHLLGEHDFSALRGADCQSKSTKRNLMHLSVKRQGKMVIIDAIANAFLMHMVRNIVGVLLVVGREEKPPSWAKEVLESRDRSLAGVTADATGLYLLRVLYPKQYRIPTALNKVKFVL